MYDKKSLKAEEFINGSEILDTLKYADENKDNLALIDKIVLILNTLLVAQACVIACCRKAVFDKQIANALDLFSR